MNSCVFVALLFVGAARTLGLASEIEIDGGFIISVPDEARLIERSEKPEFPKNGCFPWVQGTGIFVDYVRWSWAAPDATFRNELKRWSSRDPKVEVTDVRAFKTSQGLECLRFEYTRKSPGKPVFYATRLLFRNAKGELICLQAFGGIRNVEAVMASVRLQDSPKKG